MQAYRVGNTSVLSADVLYRPYIILRFRVYYALIKKSVYTSIEYPPKIYPSAYKGIDHRINCSLSHFS